VALRYPSLRALARLAIAFFVLTTIALAAAPQLAADAAGEAASEAATTTSENYFIWVVRCSGLIGVVIVLLSTYFVATVMRLFVELREPVAAPPTLVEQCELFIQQRDLRNACPVAAESDSFLGRILTAGVSELSHGLRLSPVLDEVCLLPARRLATPPASQLATARFVRSRWTSPG
jgi:biopolymer transport protein ExbB